MQKIIHNVPLIGQEKEDQYIAACFAMMLSWKSGKDQNIASVINKTGKDHFPATAAGDQSIDDVRSFAANEGMTTIDTLPVKTEDLALFIFQSPLLTVFFSGDDKKIVYTIVITGITGDGSLTDSFVHIQDPDLASKGKKYKISLLDFYRQFNLAVAANNDLDLNNTNQFFCYYDSSAKRTVTSTHQSFSSRSESTDESFEWKNDT
jgi:hypothetical protein